jgi:hypothetical protein
MSEISLQINPEPSRGRVCFLGVSPMSPRGSVALLGSRVVRDLPHIGRIARVISEHYGTVDPWEAGLPALRRPQLMPPDVAGTAD